MALKQVSNRTAVLEIEGSKIHAIMPTKSVWDQYADELFERKSDGTVNMKTFKALPLIYRLCIKKIENVEIEDGGETKPVAEISDPDEIVKFMAGLSNLDAGRRIDNWLLGLAELTPAELKN